MNSVCIDKYTSKWTIIARNGVLKFLLKIPWISLITDRTQRASVHALMPHENKHYRFEARFVVYPSLPYLFLREDTFQNTADAKRVLIDSPRQ